MPLENIIYAGKCGSLLIKLAAEDAEEELSAKKVKAHARICGIGPYEVTAFLTTLKLYGCVDWDQTCTKYQVLASSRLRALITTSTLSKQLPLSELEESLLLLLEFCLRRPRLETEIKEFLSKSLSERDIEQLISLVKMFELLGIVTIPGKTEALYFNGYQFGNKAIDIGKALYAFKREERQELDELLDLVSKQPGIPIESITTSERVKQLATGLGLVDVSEVTSTVGSAQFLTIPNLSSPSVGRETEHLEDDIFNHSKLLISSLSFGTHRSTADRGKIISPAVLIDALLTRERIGPCTAIGQDYVVLEGEGVIRTFPSNKSGQFFMALRRKEPAELVKKLISSGRSDVIDAKSLPRSLELPLSYTGPEVERRVIAKKITSNDPEIISRFLEELRT